MEEAKKVWPVRELWEEPQMVQFPLKSVLVTVTTKQQHKLHNGSNHFNPRLRALGMRIPFVEV